MVLTDKNAGIFKLKLEIGKYFDTDNENLFVELREPTTEEVVELSAQGNQEGKADEGIIFKMIPSMIIDHNFENEGNKKMATDDVWKLIMQRALCATEIVEQWSNSIPLANRKLEK